MTSTLNGGSNMDKSATTAALVYNLCCRVTGYSGANVSKSYQFATGLLAHSDGHVDELDEFATVELIQKRFSKENRPTETLLFAELHRKLQTSPLLRNRTSVLQLMYTLSSIKNKSQTTFLTQQSRNTSQLSPVFQHKNSLHKVNGNETNNKNAVGSTDIMSLKIYSDISALPAIQSHHLNETILKKQFGNPENQKNEFLHSRLRGSRVAHISAILVNKEKQDEPERSPRRREKSPSLKLKQNNLKPEDLPSQDISEKDLLRELLFVFQGIEGRLIKKEAVKGVFYLDPKVKISKPLKEMVLRLSYLGWMFNETNEFCAVKSKDKTFGLVGQSFVSAVQEQLTEFYRLLAVLESQLQQDLVIESNGMTSGLTLRRLMVWCLDPFVRMKYLAAMVRSCEGQKGGALASVVHSFLHHGDPIVQHLVKHILTLVAQPILKMLKSWMFNGELEDVYQEFFVASNPTTLNESSLWYEKYSLRKQMVPSFLSMEEAKKILSTGKTINFLRQVCHDLTKFKGQNCLKKDLSFNTIESLFTNDKDGDFQALLDKTYRDISKHVLSVLHTQFKFMEHLQAMRRYLLLGQGDFIRHLMDLLEGELSKPANLVQLHNLSGILECAIRSTNAQFDNPEILQRLDVQLTEVNEGDVGWDVFNLDYHMDGPIGTIFTPNSRMSYLRLFNSLWRAKRMEYVLSSMWKKQVTYSQMLRSIKEVKPLLHQFQMLLGEMVHFVQQMQYYIAFEVMECCWAELQKKVLEARDLDEVIKAHEEFLDMILTRSLLNSESEDLLNRLRLIYDTILLFQTLQEDFWKKTIAEVQARARREELVAQKTSSNKWGMGTAETEIDAARRKEYIENAIPKVSAEFRIRARHYRDTVHIFLKMLMDHSDGNLRFLGFRLDFNEYYKKQNTSLQTSLTFQHSRKKSTGIAK